MTTTVMMSILQMFGALPYKRCEKKQVNTDSKKIYNAIKLGWLVLPPNSERSETSRHFSSVTEKFSDLSG